MRSPFPTHIAIPVFTALTMLLLSSFIIPGDEPEKKATTGGELSFTIRTVTDGGTYSPKHVLAIWIEYNGDFVKTRKAMANQRKQYLYTWKAASNYNVVDAITGPTLTSHQTHTVTWDCTDLDGNIVPDGSYDVYTEFTDKHAQGPLYVLSFTKGEESISLSPEDETYFKDIELEFTPFVAEFSTDITSLCQWGTVTFNDESANATSWEWDFGEGAAPATATTQGPHTVFYTTPGVKSVSLTINGSVTETKTDLITVFETPVAAFSYSSNALTVDFSNQSTGAVSYLWEFGDGTTSTENNPTHTYSTAGTYDVILNAANSNCEDYGSMQIIVPLVGVQDVTEGNEIRIFPNPAAGYFFLDRGNSADIQKIGIFAASGDYIPLKLSDAEALTFQRIELPGLKPGTYILKLETKTGVYTNKIMIR